MADPGDNTKMQKKHKRINSDSYVPENSPPEKMIRRTKSIPGGVYKLNRVNSLQLSNSVNSVNSGLDSLIGREVDLEHVADLLNILDEREVGIPPGLESVVRSLEEEIMSAPEKRVADVAEVELCSRELVYLLEASDDELGLPPRFTDSLSTKEERVGEDFGLEFTGEVIWPDGEMSGYEPFDFGISGCGCDADYVAWEGLFDDVAEDTKMTWHQESLLAL